jgi:putative colanic acid biosynthesis UDP-glucose lipid carrier transferase
MNKIQERKTFHYEKARVINLHEYNHNIKDINGLLLKRIFDISVSFFVIIFILSWLLPILAILIKFSSKGPILFIQKRIGASGKVFNCIKLRTMVINDQANIQQAYKNDPRITFIGKFLRLSCMDELPQFFNVFIGNMSIVGPRPHMIKDCHEFSKIIPTYNLRNLVKPGITGMAQVKGFRGQTIDNYDVVHRYKWDMFYIKNLSFRLDMRIIKLTITTTLSAIFVRAFAGKEPLTANTFGFEAREILN